MMRKVSVTITYSRPEKRWIVTSNGLRDDCGAISYEFKSREAALTMIADLFEMNL